MLKIGEFSKLCQLSVKTLRYYADVGLLTPAHIDETTSYRYYTVEQLQPLHRIVALRELGLSLEQIKILVEGDFSDNQIRDMLMLRRAEIEQRMDVEQRKLSQVDFRLRMLALEEDPPRLDVVIKELPTVYALTLRRSMAPEDMVPFGLEIEQALKRQNILSSGPVMEIRYAAEYYEGHEDVEFVVPVDEDHMGDVKLDTFGVLRPRTIAGLEKAACTMHRGVDPIGFFDTVPVFQRWLVTNGYRLCNSNRMVFHRGPMEHSEYKDWIFEVQYEVEDTK